MIIRAGFLLVALVSAITVGQINLCRARKRSSSTDEHGNGSSHGGRIRKKNSKFDASHVERREEEEKIENCRSESVLEELSSKAEKNDCKMDEFSVQEKKWDSVYEINRLKKIVKEKEQRGENLEVQLIELYCLKGRQSGIAYLQKQLKDKTAETHTLRATINKLQSERKLLNEEVKHNQLAKKQLETAKLTILELQVKMEVDADRLKGHLVVLKEQVSGFGVDGTFRKDNKLDKKLKAIREVELEALKMKRRHRELQLERRELALKLDAAQARIAALSGMTEQTVVAGIKEQINRLKGANHYLREQVEELYRNRFSDLEELVYQRQLNSCLRFELQDRCSLQPRRLRPNVRKKLYFRSEDESKLSSLDHASERSSAESDEITNTTINSSSSSSSIKSEKSNVIFNIKRWRRGNNDASANAENSSLQRKPVLFRRFSMSSVPSSTSGQRNKGERGTSFPVEKDTVQGSTSPEIPATRRVRRVSFNDSLNSVAYTYDHTARSVQGVENDGQNIAEIFSEWSDMKTSSSLGSILHKEESEMPLERAKVIDPMASGDLNKQDSGSNKINTQVELKTEIVPAECLSSGTPNVAPRTSKFVDQMVNLIVAFVFIFFLFLVYFTLLSR